MEPPEPGDDAQPAAAALTVSQVHRRQDVRRVTAIALLPAPPAAHHSFGEDGGADADHEGDGDRVLVGLDDGHIEEYRVLRGVGGGGGGPQQQQKQQPRLRLAARRRIFRAPVRSIAPVRGAARVALLAEDGSAVLASAESLDLAPLPGVLAAGAATAAAGAGAGGGVATAAAADPLGGGGGRPPRLAVAVHAQLGLSAALGMLASAAEGASSASGGAAAAGSFSASSSSAPHHPPVLRRPARVLIFHVRPGTGHTTAGDAGSPASLALAVNVEAGPVLDMAWAGRGGLILAVPGGYLALSGGGGGGGRSGGSSGGGRNNQTNSAIAAVSVATDLSVPPMLSPLPRCGLAALAWDDALVVVADAAGRAARPPLVLPGAPLLALAEVGGCAVAVCADGEGAGGGIIAAFDVETAREVQRVAFAHDDAYAAVRGGLPAGGALPPLSLGGDGGGGAMVVAAAGAIYLIEPVALEVQVVELLRARRAQQVLLLLRRALMMLDDRGGGAGGGGGGGGSGGGGGFGSSPPPAWARAALAQAGLQLLADCDFAGASKALLAAGPDAFQPVELLALFPALAPERWRGRRRRRRADEAEVDGDGGSEEEQEVAACGYHASWAAASGIAGAGAALPPLEVLVAAHLAGARRRQQQQQGRQQQGRQQQHVAGGGELKAVERALAAEGRAAVARYLLRATAPAAATASAATAAHPSPLSLPELVDALLLRLLAGAGDAGALERLARERRVAAAAVGEAQGALEAAGRWHALALLHSGCGPSSSSSSSSAADPLFSTGPGRALEIWRRLAEGQVAEAPPAAAPGAVARAGGDAPAVAAAAAAALLADPSRGVPPGTVVGALPWLMARSPAAAGAILRARRDLPVPAVLAALECCGGAAAAASAAAPSSFSSVYSQDARWRYLHHVVHAWGSVDAALHTRLALDLAAAARAATAEAAAAAGGGAGGGGGGDDDDDAAARVTRLLLRMEPRLPILHVPNDLDDDEADAARQQQQHRQRQQRRDQGMDGSRAALARRRIVAEAASRAAAEAATAAHRRSRRKARGKPLSSSSAAASPAIPLVRVTALAGGPLLPPVAAADAAVAEPPAAAAAHAAVDAAAVGVAAAEGGALAPTSAALFAPPPAPPLVPLVSVPSAGVRPFPLPPEPLLGDGGMGAEDHGLLLLLSPERGGGGGLGGEEEEEGAGDGATAAATGPWRAALAARAALCHHLQSSRMYDPAPILACLLAEEKEEKEGQEEEEGKGSDESPSNPLPRRRPRPPPLELEAALVLSRLGEHARSAASLARRGRVDAAADYCRCCASAGPWSAVLHACLDAAAEAAEAAAAGASSSPSPFSSEAAAPWYAAVCRVIDAADDASGGGGGLVALLPPPSAPRGAGGPGAAAVAGEGNGGGGGLQHHHHHQPDARTAVLRELPDGMPVALAHAALSRLVAGAAHRRRSAQVARSLARAAHAEALARRARLLSAPPVVVAAAAGGGGGEGSSNNAATAVCGGCGRALGLRVFVRHPSGALMCGRCSGAGGAAVAEEEGQEDKAAVDVWGGDEGDGADDAPLDLSGL